MSKSASSILTERLELRLGTVETSRAELEGREVLSRALGVAVPADWPPDLYDDDAVRHTLRRLEQTQNVDPFAFYYFILRPQSGGGPQGTLIGAGGFKAPPDANGEVELGYAVVSSYQRRGLASEAVRGMLAFGFANPDVDVISAHTLVGLTPSIGVLDNTGFHYVGVAEDPDAPPGEQVIRYEIRRSEYIDRARLEI